MGKKKEESTFDKFLSDPKQRVLYEKEYQELLLSELLIALMEEDQISVRKLAQAAGISPTVIQEIRSGKKKNITVQTLLKIVESLGYSLIVEPKTRIATQTLPSICFSHPSISLLNAARARPSTRSES